MIYLPKCLEKLIPLTARESGRFTMSCIRLVELVTDEGETCYRVEATDGRAAAVVRGTCVESPQVARAVAKLPELDPAGVEGLVPAEEFQRAIRQVAKGTELVVSLGADEAILATAEVMVRAPYVVGRYPDINAVLPRTGAPLSIRVNPLLLVDLLRAAAACCEDPTPWVELLIWPQKDHPLGVITRGEKGLTFDGLMMPLT